MPFNKKTAVPHTCCNRSETAVRKKALTAVYPRGRMIASTIFCIILPLCRKSPVDSSGTVQRGAALRMVCIHPFQGADCAAGRRSGRTLTHPPRRAHDIFARYLP